MGNNSVGVKFPGPEQLIEMDDWKINRSINGNQ